MIAKSSIKGEENRDENERSIRQCRKEGLMKLVRLRPVASQVLRAQRMAENGIKISEKQKSVRVEPDHFLAIKLAHQESLKSAVLQVQETFVAKAPHLKNALVDPESIHITLAVLKLGSDEGAKQMASARLKEVVERLKPMLCDTLVLDFQRLDTFRKKVLYVSPTKDSTETLKKITESLIPCFEEYLIEKDGKSALKRFRPHMTVAKCSQLKGRARWETVIEESLYESHIDISINGVEVSEIQLCAMQGRVPGNYYQVLAAHSFHSDSYSSPT
jgi:2'-5' RNA ligase